MVIWLARWFLNAIALSLVSSLVPGFHVRDFWSALIAVIVITVLNMVLKPILFLLTLPVTILTLGLFLFILNAILFIIAGSISPGLTIDGLGSALIGSLLYSFFGAILLSLIK